MLNTNMCSDINSIHQVLLRHLQVDGRSVVVSKEFSALETNSQRVTFAYSALEGYNLFPAIKQDVKSDEKAYEFRQKGNLIYKKRNIGEALELYTKSIAYASVDGRELALAYGNRSAALFEIGFYKECLQDIREALDHNYPENLVQKLFKRQTNAKELENRQCRQLYYQKIPIFQEQVKHSSIQSAAKTVEIIHSNDLGRHVVATEDIKIGEIIAVEKPFCSVLIEDFLTHCHECLQLCYNLLPCPGCTQAMFCNKNCMEKSQKHHKYECNILKTLREMKVDTMKMIALRIALVTKEEYNILPSKCTLKDNEMYCSNRYKEIHNLIGNTDQRTLSDLFKRVTAAAVLFHFIKKFFNFFENEEQELTFKEILLLHMQTAPCNFHEISELNNNNGVFEPREIGAGAFAFLSMFNHSCSPNVVRQCYGTSIVLRAIKTIRKGEQCFDNYGYLYAVTPKEERQQNLKEQYFFDCICEACSDDWPLYQDLPTVETDISIEFSDFEKLIKGDVECAEAVLTKVLPRMKELEGVQPNKNFSEMQELIKQCFAILGNKKKSI